MCGRYAAATGTDELVEQLKIDVDRTGEPVRSTLGRPQYPPPGQADYNMGPGKNARVVVTRPVPDDTGPAHSDPESAASTERALRLLSWGLVPPWAKDTGIGARMINARVETVLEKRSYRGPVLQRRLLVPADGWYEWQVLASAGGRGAPAKQPWFMQRTDGAPLTFGGIYEFWKDPACAPDDPLAWLASFSIITQEADPDLAPIHDRQPLVIEPENWQRWLDPGLTSKSAVADLLVLQPPGRFTAHPVGRAVGNIGNNGPDLVRPVEPLPTPGGHEQPPLL